MTAGCHCWISLPEISQSQELALLDGYLYGKADIGVGPIDLKSQVLELEVQTWSHASGGGLD